MAMQNLKDIALELLEKYKKAQDSVIWEYSGRIEEEEKELDEEAEKYRILINTIKPPVMHGAWDYIMPVDGPERCRYQCSECHRGALLDYWKDDVKSLFCPTCGACMDLEGKKYWEEYDGELRLAKDG